MTRTAFAHVEAKPQALEWILCHGAQIKFQISLDNVESETANEDAFAFQQAVNKALTNLLETGLWQRAENFFNALCEFYGTHKKLCSTIFI